MNDSPIRALTVKQPWATLIAARIKRVENRTWMPSQFTGPLLIHAGAAQDKAAWDHEHVRKALFEAVGNDELPTGAIIAVVGSVRAHRDSIGGHCEPWGFPDCWHWELSDVRPLPHPIPAKGRLGLWLPDAETLAAVEAQYSEMEVAR